MFAALTEEELWELFRTIKSGRDRVWNIFDLSNSFCQVCVDATDLLADLRAEIQGR